MGKLRRYITANFSMLFFSIFMPLFTVASVVFLVKLAKFTSVIQFKPSDMLTLYLFNLPEILFYLLPVTFFVAAAIALHKLSADNETVVIFTLGLTPNHILKIFFVPALLLSLVLFFMFYYLFPHTKIMSKNFIIQKKSEAKFNLEASEFGYSFGPWQLFIGSDNKGESFSDVYLFNKEKREEVLISAKEAKIINDNGILRLQLDRGEGYNYTESTLTQTDFDTLLINDMLMAEQKQYLNAWEYWNDPNRNHVRWRQMLRNVLMACFPLLSLTMILFIGVVYSRHQSSHLYLYIFLTVIAYYTLSIGLESYLTFTSTPLIALFWLIVTIWIYRRQVLARY
jgi:lipopolysaccharide export system permease protein